MKYYAAPLLLFLFAYLIPLDWRPMVTPDEHRYALVPREMIESGNYLQPRLVGLAYSEKPALGYQMTALSFRLLGENNFALRFPVALSAGFCAFLLTLLLRRFTGEDKLAALGALLFLTGGLVYGVGTFAVLDMQLTMFVTGVLACFLPACLEEKFNRVKIVLLLLAGVFAGLAFLTKGFIAFAVPAVVIVPFLVWEKRWKDFLILPWLPLAGVLLVALPWSLAIHRADGDFWNYFFWEEHINRFFGHNNPDHESPFWSLIPVLVLGILPAGLLAPYAVVGLWPKRRELLKESYIRFLLCFAVFPFLFFSASSGKLPTYILPCMVPLAALGAIGLAMYFRRGGGHRAFRYLTATLGMALMIFAVLTFAARLIVPGYVEAIQTAAWLPNAWLLGLTALAVFAWGLALFLGRKKPWKWALTAFFAGMVPVIVFGQLMIPEGAFGDKTPNAALRELGAEIKPDSILVVHRSVVHAAAWVLHRNDLILVESQGEFDYGLKRPEGAGRLLAMKEFNELLHRPGRPEIAYLSRDRSNHNLRRYYLLDPIPPHHTRVANQIRLFTFPAP